MSCSKQAEQELWNKALSVIAISVFDRFLCKDLSVISVKNQAVDIAKDLIKNDKKTQKQIGKVLECKINNFLN